jgi:hypothetical protein
MDPMFIKKTNGLIRIIIIATVIGLITIPIFPWIMAPFEGESSAYISEGFIEIAKNGGYGGSSSSEIKIVSDDLGFIGLSFWLVLLFGVISLIGIMIAKIKSRWSFIPSILLLLIGCMTILFSVFIVYGHWNFFTHVNEFSEGGISTGIFGFNYIPLVMGIILLISSISYTAKVVSFSAYSIPNYMNQQQTNAEAQYSQYQKSRQEKPVIKKEDPPKPSTEPKTTPNFCPNCGTKVKPDIKFCPSCGNKLKG